LATSQNDSLQRVSESKQYEKTINMNYGVLNAIKILLDKGVDVRETYRLLKIGPGIPPNQ
jgi:hypothetical protein